MPGDLAAGRSGYTVLMLEGLGLLAFAVGYFVLTRWVLPRFGIRT